MTKSSNCEKLKLSRAYSNRIVNRFPQPYHPDATPYLSISNFDPKVRSCCLSERTPQSVGLRVAKAVVIGDSSVGKTSIVKRFCKNIFDRDYKATIGVDFEVERFDILGSPFNLQIWDTAGQEKFRSIASAYYRNAHVIIVVFDVNNMESLTNSGQWLADALMVCQRPTPPLCFLVANKLDSVSRSHYHQIEISAVDVARDLGAEYWSVSAKTGERIGEFFFRVTSLLFNQIVLMDISQRDEQNNENISRIGRPVSNIHLTTTDEREITEHVKKPRCCKSN